MSIYKMSKVLVAGHLSEFDLFVDDLQHGSVFQPAELPQSPASKKEVRSLSNSVNPAGPHVFHQLDEALTFLEQYRPRASSLQSILKSPFFVSRAQYHTTANNFDPRQLLERCTQIKSRIDRLNRERETLLRENLELEPWKDVPISVNETGVMEHVHIVVGRLNKESVQEVFDLVKVEGEILGHYGKKTIVLLAFHWDHGSDVLGLLQKVRFEEMPLWDIIASPQDQHRHNLKCVVEIDGELKQLSREAKDLLKDLDSLRLLVAYYDNLDGRNILFDYWLSTRNAFIIAGWVRAHDLEQLRTIATSYQTIQYEEMVPSPEDAPPVSLQNPKTLAPFELITRLYGCPSYGSLDPSLVVSIFFVLFFSLCLTDAGYGLILSVIALIGLHKLRRGREILWILFWGGIFTLLAGILTGGIFGDLFRSDDPFLNVPALTSLRDEMLWFDTMKEPMVFFRLVLLLGVIQVTSGLIMGLVGNLRAGRIMDGLVDKGTWLVVLGALLAVLFSSEMCIKLSLVNTGAPPLSSSVTRPALILAAMMALVIVGFGARDEKSLFFRFFVGFLKLSVLGGVFSYLGDILSYIRLMALGMVTAGIGMAINTIAFMLVDIPAIGILLTAVVLIVGHCFNLAINLLGGFVHTLRLQYVEFFSKFFVGGGRTFKPLCYSHRYVNIVE